MSYRTYTLKALLAEPMPLTDGIASLFNNSTDANISIKINRVSILPAGGQNTAASVNPLQLYKITDLISGTDSSTITPVKHDTNSSDLPSQVVILSSPLSATTSDRYCNRVERPAYSITTANAGMASMMPGPTKGNRVLNTACVLNVGQDSTSEPIILREGEGIALFQSVFGIPHSMTINVVIRNNTTGATYTVRSIGCGTARILTKPLFGIFNGSGSGVVLSVNIVQIPAEGEAVTISTNRLVLIEGHEGGTDITDQISPHDTQFPLPSYVEALGGPFVAYPYGRSAAGNYFWNIYHGTNSLEASIASQQAYGRIRSTVLQPWGTDQGSSLKNGPYFWDLYNHNSEKSLQQPIILRANQGIALVSGRAGTIDSSTFNYKEIYITFTIIDENASSSGVIYAI
jgi:hypothetical protein